MNKLNEYLSYNKQLSFNEVLFSYIDKSGHKDCEIYKKAGIDRKLFSKIRCDKNYIPKRNTVYKLGFALKLNLADFNKLLKSAGYTLSNSKFDLTISYCLENNIYDLYTVNDYLSLSCCTYL